MPLMTNTFYSMTRRIRMYTYSYGNRRRITFLQYFRHSYIAVFVTIDVKFVNGLGGSEQFA